jgi:hypothetical protein
MKYPQLILPNLPMKRNHAFGLSAALILLTFGCSSKNESAAPAASTAATEAAGSAADQTSTDGIAAARNSLKAGNVDEAAAKLAQLQLQRASFNAQQAKDYRQTYSEAYDRVMEGIQRGDPNAQAALQLLRAAAPR